ncbi:hypothetical protein, partial [Nocardia sp. NPDC004722]
MTQGWPSSMGSFDSFDDIFSRFFGSGMSRQPPVQRIDLSRLEVDESLLTGEADPIDKTVGGPIMSDSFVVS